MAMRSSWEGFLKLSLISVPVRAYNAAVPGGGDVHFHLIHKNCDNRIRYQKVCPEHGEVTKEEIVSGYGYEKGKYVEFDPEEISKLRAENDQAINIDAFTSPAEIDPIYMSGKTFFLVPDGPAGQKPYALLHQVMKEKNRYAVATVILGGHEETVVLRPLEKLLSMTLLYHENQVKNPAAFEDESREPKVSSQELKLAGNLVDAATTAKVDLSQYKDLYTESVTELIEAKLAGRKAAAPAKEKAPTVINLMDALRKSLDQTRAGTKQRQPRAAAQRGHDRHHGKRKTG